MKERLRKEFYYHQGVLYRRPLRGNSWVAGCVSPQGYVHIRLKNRKRYLRHRLVYIMFHGKIPIGQQIDHINQVPGDDRIENLRLVSICGNQRNRKKNLNNKSGHSGVRWRNDCQKWAAHIGVNGKQIILGCFSNKKEAVQARKTAEAKYGFHPNHGSHRHIGN